MRFQKLAGSRDLMLVAAGVVLANFLLASVALTAALRDAAPEVAVLEAFLLSASQIVAGLVTLTPGAVGFQEAAGLYVAKTFPATMAEVFAVLIWVRVVRIAVAGVLAIPSLYILKGRMGSRDVEAES